MAKDRTTRLGWNRWKKASERGWGWNQRKRVLPFCAPLTNDVFENVSNEVGTFTRAGTPTYISPVDGLVTQVAANTPRFEEHGILLEPGGTNLCLYARDFSQVDYAKTNCTATKDQIGHDGVTNSASSLLATDANATCLQTITSAIDDYTYSVDIKRITGTGTIEITVDDGANWEDITASLSTTAWYRGVETQNTTNPVVGIRLVTDTDKIAVDYGQCEAFPVVTSRIPTTTIAVSRTTESGYPYWTLPTGLFDTEGTAIIWARFGYAKQDPGSHTGIVACRDGSASLLYLQDSTGNIRTYDGANAAINNVAYIANTWYKLVVKWSSTTLKMRIGYDSGSGISWGTEETFDGAYTVGSYLRLGYNLFGPMHLKNLRIYNRVLSDAEINRTSSP